MQHETVGQIFKMMYDFIKIHELKLQLLFQKIRCPPQAVSSHLVQILLCDITCVSNLSQLIKRLIIILAQCFILINGQSSMLIYVSFFKDGFKWGNQTWKLSLMDDVFWALIMEPFAPFIKLACFHMSWHKHQTTKQVLKNETSSQINDVEVTHCL